MEFKIDIDTCPPAKGDNDWKSYHLADLPFWRDINDIPITQFQNDDISEQLLLWIMSPYRSVHLVVKANLCAV